MKEFEVTLTAVSRKTFKLSVDSQENAFLLAEAILENSDLESDCPYPGKECKHRLPACGGCMADSEDN